jgi:hypothetical protein
MNLGKPSDNPARTIPAADMGKHTIDSLKNLIKNYRCTSRNLNIVIDNIADIGSIEGRIEFRENLYKLSRKQN